jgi:dynein light intermediate chain, axonemal
MDSKDSLVRYNTPSLVLGRKGPAKKAAIPKLDRKSALPQTEDILNAILPPREWTSADGQLWVQHVSSTPATRLEVVALQEQLDLKLQQRQARETGICPVREELYAQCFGKCPHGKWMVSGIDRQAARRYFVLAPSSLQTSLSDK